jgi:hypothetical protein
VTFIREGSRLGDFIKWATARADRMDPRRGLREEVAAKTKAGGAST